MFGDDKVDKQQDKDEEDATKRQDNRSKAPPKPSKNLPGAVSLFGGVDIFAGQKPGKVKRQQPGICNY